MKNIKTIMLLLGTVLLSGACRQKIEYTSKDWVTMTFPQDNATLLISAPNDEVIFAWEKREGATYKVLFDQTKEFLNPVEFDAGELDTLRITAGTLHKALLKIDPEYHGSKRFFWRVDQTMGGGVKSCWRYFTAVYAAGSFVDDRDGVTYNTIEYEVDEFTKYTIMTDNLKAEIYSDGTKLRDSIRTCNAEGYVDDEFFVASVGCYYTWRDAVNMDWQQARRAYLDGEQVQGICPDGWHLPSYDEWDNLISYFGGETDGGLKTCVSKYWEAFPSTPSNELKFNVYPSGQFWSAEAEEVAANVGRTAFFWSSTPAVAGTSYAWGTFLENDDINNVAAFCIWSETSGGIYKYYRDSGFGTSVMLRFPVRCILDYEVKTED